MNHLAFFQFKFKPKKNPDFIDDRNDVSNVQN